jgi:hypothetical protein
MRLLAVMLWMLALVGLSEAQAPPTWAEQDLKIIIGTLGFLSTPPSRVVTVAVVHGPGEDSAARAREVVGWLEATRSSRFIARATPVAGPDLARLDRVDLVLFVEPMAEVEAAFAERLAGKGVLTVGKDPACVARATCVLAIQRGQQVAVILSRQAAERAGVGFRTAFRLMVEER